MRNLKIISSIFYIICENKCETMFIKDFFDYLKVKKIIKEIIVEEDLLNNLSKLFSTENYTVNFKQDWIGRIYAVINPVVQSPQNRIFEYDEKGVNLKSFIDKWVIEHMIAADNFVKNHQLFDILSYEFQPLDEDYNFLFTMTPISWFELKHSFKREFWWILGIVIVGITALIIL